MIRISAASVKEKVKTNSVKESFVNRFCNTRPITRGVSCALASCTVIRSAEQTKTMSVNIAEAKARLSELIDAAPEPRLVLDFKHVEHLSSAALGVLITGAITTGAGIMAGLPVCIRLFDPPLHEFLPHSREGLRELAEAPRLARMRSPRSAASMTAAVCSRARRLVRSPSTSMATAPGT